MNDIKTKVLYITGSPRSGSTILSKVLGQISGFFQSGELRFLWDRNFLDGYPCGCGNQFEDCEIWSNVFNIAYGGFNQVDPEKMLYLRENYTRTKHIPFMLTSSGRKRLRVVLEEYLSNLDRLYVAVQKATGCEVIIDSSKFSSYGFILSMLPSIEVYYLHLIRDSRAVAFSRLKKKKWEETGIYMDRYNPLRSSLQWSALNVTSELLRAPSAGKFIRVKYEDFMVRPKSIVENVVNAVQASQRDFSFINENTVEIHKTHTNWGNPNRNQDGKIKLEIDDEWRLNLNQGSRALISTITYPLLLRYGYI